LKNCAALLTSFTVAACATSLRADQITVLGTASSFAVFGASTVTSTGDTVLFGNLGLFPGSSITGFLPGVVTGGTTHISDSIAIAAHADAQTGYNYLAALSPTQDLTGQDLGGKTLTPGVYFFASSAQLTGVLTLDFQGRNDVDIVIQTGSTLTTASNSTVRVINQGTNDNVYYQIGSSATLGTYTVFMGDIVATASITVTTGVDFSCGSAIALNGAVTLDSNSIRDCSTTGSDVTEFAPIVLPPLPPPSAVPEPGSLALVSTGLFGIAGFLRRRHYA
jgi:hypothetical protein